MNLLEFNCNGNDLELISQNDIDNINCSFRDIYTKSDAIAKLALEIRKKNKDYICKIPFCVSIEAEALGAKVRIHDSNIPPSFCNYRYKDIDELDFLPNIDFSKGRINEVLESIKILKSQNQIVSVRVEAPFTVFSMLMDLKKIMYYFVKVPERIEVILDRISKQILEYMKLILASGAQIISYADPSAMLEYLGCDMYKNLCAKYTCNILKAILPYVKKQIIHVCGKTSTMLYKTNLCELVPIYLNTETYGQAIVKSIERDDIKIVGHNCLMNTRLKSCRPLIKLNLK